MRRAVRHLMRPVAGFIACHIFDARQPSRRQRRDAADGRELTGATPPTHPSPMSIPDRVMRHRASYSLAFVLVAAPSLAGAQSKNWKKDLTAQLEQSIQLTKFSPDRFRVTGPGSMFTIQRDGIVAVLATDMFGLINHVTPDGSV